MAPDIPEAPSIVDLLKRDIPKTRSWIEPTLLTHSGILICAASPKAGKSFFATELARCISTGDTPFGYDKFSVPEKGRVLLLDYEVTEGGLKERTARVLENENEAAIQQNFRYVSKDTDKYKLPEMLFSDPKGFDRLYRLIDATQPNVLIIDPIRRALGSWDESKAVDVGQLFNRLDKIIHDYRHNKMSIVINHHYRKMPSEKYREDWDPLEPDNASGSGRFFGDTDSLVTMYRDPEKKFTKTGQEWWSMKVRWTLRHGADPGDMFLSVNQNDDLRVRFAGKVVETPALLEHREKPILPLKGEQTSMMFDVPGKIDW